MFQMQTFLAENCEGEIHLSLRTKKYNSIKEMITDLWTIARDKNHPQFKEARQIIDELWQKTFRGMLPPPTFSKEEEERIKVIFT